MLGAGEGFVDVGANIFGADVAVEASFTHKRLRLWACAANQHRPSAIVKSSGQFFQRSNAGSVDGGHVAKPKDYNQWKGRDLVSDDIDLIGDAKEKRTMDAIDRGVIGNVFVLKIVDTAVLDVLVGDFGDGGGERNFADKGERSEDHADFDGKGEVRENCEEDGDGPDMMSALLSFKISGISAQSPML